MYQVYELPTMRFLQGFTRKQEAIDFADKQRKDWQFMGQDKHFHVSYFGYEVYFN
jgi:hypothetical protein